MSSKLISYLAVAAMALIAITFELGGLAPADALFGVLTVLIGFTAWRFLRQDGQPVSQAARAVFSRPKGRGGRMLGYLAYVGVSAVGLVVALQAVSSI